MTVLSIPKIWVAAGVPYCTHTAHSTPGARDTLSQPSAIAQADLGMHDQHAWRHSAMAALAAHFTCTKHMTCPSAQETLHKDERHTTASMEEDTGVATSAATDAVATGASATTEREERAMGLILQRSVQYAMVCSSNLRLYVLSTWIQRVHFFRYYIQSAY